MRRLVRTVDAVPRATEQRELICGGDSFHPGQCADPLEQRIETLLHLRSSAFRDGQLHVDEQQSIGIKSGVDALQAECALQQQTGDHEQHE